MSSPMIHGTVSHIGMRTSTLQRDDGAEVRIATRHLLSKNTQVFAPGIWKTTVSVQAPAGLSYPEVKDTLWHVATVLPWRSFDTLVEVISDPSHPTRWTVSLALLDRKYEKRTRDALAQSVQSLVSRKRESAGEQV